MVFTSQMVDAKALPVNLFLNTVDTYLLIHGSGGAREFKAVVALGEGVRVSCDCADRLGLGNRSVLGSGGGLEILGQGSAVEGSVAANPSTRLLPGAGLDQVPVEGSTVMT